MNNGWEEDLKNAKQDLDKKLNEYVHGGNGVEAISGISVYWNWIYASDSFYFEALKRASPNGTKAPVQQVVEGSSSAQGGGVGVRRKAGSYFGRTNKANEAGS